MGFIKSSIQSNRKVLIGVSNLNISRLASNTVGFSIFLHSPPTLISTLSLLFSLITGQIPRRAYTLTNGDENRLNGDDNRPNGDDNKPNGDDNKLNGDDNKLNGDENWDIDIENTASGYNTLLGILKKNPRITARYHLVIMVNILNPHL